MKCLVTGASGFLGANLVHALNARGHQVRALLRPGSDRRGLAGTDYEAAFGDVTDRAAVAAALRGCDWCFHVAACYQLWLRDYRPMYGVNVEGTRIVIESACAAGCSRIVYTSTVGCIGLPSAANGRVTPADEHARVSETELSGHYKLSKWRAEAVARACAAQGAPVVIVNPSAPVGPRDTKPTPTGKFVLDYLNRAMPAYLDTGLNFVHVRDVVIGHILAAEKGRLGERYILGHAEGNLTMQEAFAVLEDITGLPAPRCRMPYPAALATAHLSELLARVTGQPPIASLEGVRMARHKMFYNPAKAIGELGLPQTPPRRALADAVEWFQQHGYVKR